MTTKSLSIRVLRLAPDIELLQARGWTVARVGERFVTGAELLAAVRQEQRRREQQ